MSKGGGGGGGINSKGLCQGLKSCVKASRVKASRVKASRVKASRVKASRVVSRSQGSIKMPIIKTFKKEEEEKINNDDLQVRTWYGQKILD